MQQSTANKASLGNEVKTFADKSYLSVVPPLDLPNCVTGCDYQTGY